MNYLYPKAIPSVPLDAPEIWCGDSSLGRQLSSSRVLTAMDFNPLTSSVTILFTILFSYGVFKTLVKYVEYRVCHFRFPYNEL